MPIYLPGSLLMTCLWFGKIAIDTMAKIMKLAIVPDKYKNVSKKPPKALASLNILNSDLVSIFSTLFYNSDKIIKCSASSESLFSAKQAKLVLSPSCLLNTLPSPLSATLTAGSPQYYFNKSIYALPLG